MTNLEIIGFIVIVIGAIFVAIGILGMLRFNDFFEKILVASKIDVVGTITIILGVAIMHGVSFFSARLLILLGIVMILGPLCTHVMASSAYESLGKNSKNTD